MEGFSPLRSLVRSLAVTTALFLVTGVASGGNPGQPPAVSAGAQKAQPPAASAGAPGAPALQAQPVAAAPPPVNPALSPEQIRAQAETLVYQLITRVRGAGDKQSYGTAFVVAEGGWLLTNFHVIAQALVDPAHYALEIQLSDKTALPAAIESYDVVNDLALVRVGHVFASAYRLTTHQPAPGEKLYSLGLPQDTVMTIVEGLFSDTGRMGPLTRSLMSASLNHGMSGGPVVNTVGELVAVNDAIVPNSQSISILVPTRAIADFLRHATDVAAAQRGSPVREPAAVSSSALTDGIPEQIGSALRPWIAEWRLQDDGSHAVSLGRYHVAGPPPGMKCWEDAKSSSARGDAHARVCSTLGAFPILPGRTGGELSLRYVSYGSDTKTHSAKSDDPTLTAIDRLGLGHLLAADLFVGGILQKAATRFAETAKPLGDRKAEMVCHHRFLNNHNGVDLVAEYCLSAEHPLEGVYDLVLTATPIGDDETMVAELDLRGFTTSELLGAGEMFLDGISVGAGTSADASSSEGGATRR